MSANQASQWEVNSHSTHYFTGKKLISGYLRPSLRISISSVHPLVRNILAFSVLRTVLESKNRKVVAGYFMCFGGRSLTPCKKRTPK
jgi:hypothetical protein